MPRHFGCQPLIPNHSMRMTQQDFPGCPLVKTLHFKCRGRRFNPWLGS